MLADDAMIRFRVLDGLDLSDGSRSFASVLAQPKRTALLAYLTLAGSFHRRDKLIGLFWPDLDEKRARDALNTAVHYLRRALGTEVVLSRGREELGIGESVWCDAREFERALDQGSLEAALDLYRGDLLPGLYLGGSSEFEQWLELERARLRGRAIAAAMTLAERSAAAGDALGTGGWARRVAAYSPGDEAVIRHLIGLLDQVGDRGTAMMLYDRLQAWLRDELELEPSPETEQQVAKVRARTHGVSDTGAGAPILDKPRSWTSASAAPPNVRAPDASESRPRRLVTAAAAVAVLLVSIAAAVRVWPGPDAAEADGPAMEAYREGEEHFQAGRYPLAVRALQRAIELDSTLALAYHRLSQATNWTGEARLSAWAAREAVRRGAGLSREQQLRFEAWAAYVFGDAVRADSLYRALVELVPRDAHAWFYLGEVIYHDGPMLGHPVASSRKAWETALEYQPRNAGALLHLLRIAAREHGTAELDVLAARLRGLDPETSQELEIRALQTFITGTPDERAEFVALAQPEGDNVVLNLAVSVAANARDLDGAMKLAALMTLPERGWTLRASGHLLRAQLLATSGRWSLALDELRPTIAMPAARSLEYRSVLLTLPFAPFHPDTLAALHDALRALPPHEPPVGPDVESIGTSAIYPPARLYLLGLTAHRLGRPDDARTWLGQLRSYDEGTAMDSGFAAHFARVLAADLLLAEGDAAGALDVLGARTIEADRNHADLLSYPKAHERWLRAEALRTLGRYDDALAWYATFPDATAHDIMYLHASLMRQADVLRSLGREQESQSVAGAAAQLR